MDLKSNYKLQTVLLFITFLIAGIGFQGFIYLKQSRLIKVNAEAIFEAEKLRVDQVFEDQIKLIEFARIRLSKRNRFNEEEFKDLIADITVPFSKLFAFNYANSDNIIEFVYPEERNKAALNQDLNNHPDIVVSQQFEEGIPRDKITFLPPVTTYQGERAVIFYCPITFQKGEQGLLNIVISANQLFSAYRSDNLTNIRGFSVLDEKTKRFYFNSIKRKGDDNFQSFSTDFMGRKVTYTFDLNELVENQQRDYTWQILFY